MKICTETLFDTVQQIYVHEEERNAPLVPASVEDTACRPAPEQAVR
jgi:hypothetical protein